MIYGSETSCPFTFCICLWSKLLSVCFKVRLRRILRASWGQLRLVLVINSVIPKDILKTHVYCCTSPKVKVCIAHLLVTVLYSISKMGEVFTIGKREMLLNLTGSGTAMKSCQVTLAFAQMSGVQRL